MLMAESEELKRLLMKVKEESENVGLKLNIQKTKIMGSGINFQRFMDVLQLLASDRNSFSAVACFEVLPLLLRKRR